MGTHDPIKSEIAGWYPISSLLREPSSGVAMRLDRHTLRGAATTRYRNSAKNGPWHG